MVLNGSDTGSIHCYLREKKGYWVKQQKKKSTRTFPAQLTKPRSLEEGNCRHEQVAEEENVINVPTWQAESVCLKTANHRKSPQINRKSPQINRKSPQINRKSTANHRKSGSA